MDRIDKDEELVCPLCGGRLFWMPASHIYACEHCKQSYSERNGVYMKKKCNLTAEKSSAVGDAAKLREALKLCLRGMCGYCRMDAEARGMTTECVNGCEALLMAKAALAAPPRNCIDKVFVLVKADAFEDETDRYKVFSSFQSANEWMRRDYISQQRKEEMADSMGVMKDDPAFFHDQPVPSSDSESAELFLGESHVVRWSIYEKELITEGGGDADK